MFFIFFSAIIKRNRSFCCDGGFDSSESRPLRMATEEVHSSRAATLELMDLLFDCYGLVGRRDLRSESAKCHKSDYSWHDFRIFQSSNWSFSMLHFFETRESHTDSIFSGFVHSFFCN